MTLQSIIDEKTVEIMKTFLCKNGIMDTTEITLFLGGSKRFRYDNDNSDHDLFIYSTVDPKTYRKILTSNGFVEIVPYSLFKGKSTGWVNKQFNTHIVIIGQWDYFVKVKEDHNIVEKFLNDNPLIALYIKEQKRFCLRKKLPIPKGSVIYKSLLTMAINNVCLY